jgi:ABC-type uncharacterized transport system involved in gliding motility auxiliary subunit
MDLAGEGDEVKRRRAGAVEFAASSALALLLLFFSTVLLTRHDLVMDLSLGQRRTLAPQTLRVIELIERPIQITAFYADLPAEQARLLNLVERYREHTRRLELRFVDADRRPDVARDYGVTTNGTVVLEDGDLRVRVADPDEAALTAGLIRVLRAEPPLIFFVTGHGESSVEDTSGAGLAEAGRMLAEQNFAIRELNTTLINRVPDEASAVILAGPEREFSPREIQLVDEYLLRGGRLFAAVEPGGARSVDSLLTRWGIEPGDGYVIDASQEQRNLLGGQEEPLIALGVGVNPDHPITRGFTFATFYPIARAVFEVDPAPSGVDAVTLIESGERTWLERTPTTEGATTYDAGVDRLGPLALGYAASVDLPAFVAGLTPERGLSGNVIEMGARQNDLRDSSLAGSQELEGERFDSGLARNARIVVFGDIDFASNANLRVHGNGDLFLASILWLTEQEDRIALPARPEFTDPFVLGARRTSLVRWVGMGIVPGLFFLAGALSLWRRRRWV